jgi:hypothetical protein
MWSGPRNISTAMMRSFENRPDTSVVDEPFYAVYLARTGLDHPMRDEVLRSQPTDWRAVVEMLLGPSPDHAPIFYQKHMTHHMLPEVGTDWMSACCNVFLIRRPDEVVASYSEKRGDVGLADIGVARQAELFEQEADRLGRAPPVIDSADVSAAPGAVLRALCLAVGISFTEKMLSWPKGRRASDGVWAPAWYDQVEQSTGFIPKAERARPKLPPALARIADAARPHYERLARWKIAGGEGRSQSLSPSS